MDISTTLNLPIPELGVCLHVFRFLKIAFLNVAVSMQGTVVNHTFQTFCFLVAQGSCMET